jgi:uncharacterized protein
MTQRITDVNGWFEVKRNPLSRVGVFPYRGASLGLEGPDADRVVRVLRPEEELSDPECIASFKLVPWVDDHTMMGPAEGLTPAEQKGVQGVIGEEVFYDSGVLYGNIKAFSNSLARLIEAGKRQLSAGYRCVYEWSSGQSEWGPYDCVQRKIRGNHLALVTEGRMGPSVAVMDALKFSFDAQEAKAMADEKKDGGGSAGAMTLEQVVKTIGEIAPQVAALTEAMGKLGGPAASAAPVTDKDPAKEGAGAEPTPDPLAAKTPAATPDAALPAAMDAALRPLRETVAAIGKTVAALDAAVKGMPSALAADVSARDKLAGRLAAHVGTFDASDKTLQQVAAYGCEKLGLKPVAGAELVAVDSFLSGAERAGSPVTVRAGLDAAPGKTNFVSRHLAGDAK